MFFLQLHVNDTIKTLALVSVWSPPHLALLQESYHTLWYCTHQGDDAIKVIDTTTIESVVSMIPQKMDLPASPSVDFFSALVPHEGSYVGEKPGLDMAHMAGADEDDENDEDNE